MRIYPVVHINTVATAVEQSAAALGAGADGIYLIHHGTDNATLFEVLRRVSEDHLNAFVGVNLLGSSTLQAIMRIEQALHSGEITRAPSGLWSDDIRSDPNPFAAKAYASETAAVRGTRILGGIAFKYTSTFTEDPEVAKSETLLLRNAVDVVTTSGSGTGTPPTVAKLRAMREVAGRPIAVASGLSASNVADFKTLVDEVLIASSIETAPYSGIFDRRALLDAIQTVHAL